MYCTSEISAQVFPEHAVNNVELIHLLLFTMWAMTRFWVYNETPLLILDICVVGLYTLKAEELMVPFVAN